MLQTWLLRFGVLLLRKPRFRRWAELEDKKYGVIKAVEGAEGSLPHFISDYLSAALFFHPSNYDTVYWKDEIDAFFAIHRVTVPITVLPLVSKHSTRKDDKDPWDYQGRLWYFYSNTIASAYGWTVKQIARLHIDEALAYIQEILTDKQLDREFSHSLSEISYPYNKTTKQSKYQPLVRPYWMFPDVHEKKKKVPAIPKALLPVGNAVRLSERYEAKETKLGTDVETISPAKRGL